MKKYILLLIVPFLSFGQQDFPAEKYFGTWEVAILDEKEGEGKGGYLFKSDYTYKILQRIGEDQFQEVTLYANDILEWKLTECNYVLSFFSQDRPEFDIESVVKWINDDKFKMYVYYDFFGGTDGVLTFYRKK